MKAETPLLKLLIARRKITQRQLARKLRISNSYLSELVLGRKRIPRHILEGLAEALKIEDPSLLLEEVSSHV